MAAETLSRSRNTNAEQARDAATTFLLEHVGHLFGAGEPHSMAFAVRSVWIVPVQLAYIHSGVLGTVGVVAVDDELNQVIAWTPLDEMKAAGRRLREQHEPDVSQQFNSAMNPPTGSHT